MQYFKEVPFAVTICDKNGKILDMNDKSINTFVKNGEPITGKSLFDCHTEPAKSKLQNLFENRIVHAYTIEKNNVKKLIYQSPWYDNGEFAGYIELSMEISPDMPHFVRK